MQSEHQKEEASSHTEIQTPESVPETSELKSERFAAIAHRLFEAMVEGEITADEYHRKCLVQPT
jgi:hypothetical protein